MMDESQIVFQRAVYHVANYFANKESQQWHSMEVDGEGKVTRIGVWPRPIGDIQITPIGTGSKSTLAHVMVNGESVRVLHRGVDFKYFNDWPWTTVRMDPLDFLVDVGIPDRYIVLSRNMRTGLFLSQVAGTMDTWSRARTNGVIYCESPVGKWLCNEVQYERKVFAPSWRVYKALGLNEARRLAYQAVIRKCHPFAGVDIMPIVKMAEAEGYMVAMTPERVF